MNETVKEPQNPLGSESLGKLLFKFSFPSIVAMLVSSLYNIVDQIFIGQGLGYLGNAATTVAFPFSTIGLAIALLLGVGSASCFSLQLGKGNSKSAAQSAGCALSVMLGASLVYVLLGECFMNQLLPLFGATKDTLGYALEYSRIILLGMPFLILGNGLSQLARADGAPTFSMACMVAGALVNCVLDPLFIFVFQWGMAGAAWATIIGQIVTVAIAVFYLPRFKHVRLIRDDFRIRASVLQSLCALGLSASLNQVAILVVQIVLNNLLRYYGGLSMYGPDIPIAASGIAFKLNGIFVSVMVGLSQGTQPIIGFNYGAGKYERVKKVLLMAMASVLVLGGLVEICFQLFPRQFILMFGNGDELYLRFGARMLQLFLMGIFIQGIQTLSSNYFSTIGQPLKGIFLSLTRTIIFFIPLVLLFSWAWGIEGILYSQPLADLIAVIFSVLFVASSFRSMNRMEKEQRKNPAA